MKVLIINQHSNNFGDDAAGCALVNMLLMHKEIEKIDIIYHATKEIPIIDSRVQHHLDISFNKVGHWNFIKYYLFERILQKKPSSNILCQWIELINEADTVFVSPCGANIGIYKDWPSLVRILMVIKQGKKLVFQYNTIGKSNNILFDCLAKYALKKSYVYVREEKSKEYLNKIGVNSIWGPDTAFALGKREYAIRSKVISFVPSSFDAWHPEFKSNPIDKKVQEVLIPQLTKWINKNDFSLEIVPHLNLPEEMEYNQKLYTEFIKAGINNITIRDDIMDVWQYDEALGSSRLVIGMRYHAVVLAAKNYRPFLAMCYENKMKEVCRYTKLSDSAIDIHEINKYNNDDLIYKKLDSIISREQQISKILNKEVEMLKPMCEIPILDICFNKELEHK